MKCKGRLSLCGLVVKLAAACTVASAQIELPPAGIITTVAGNDLQGYSGDGGPARSASFGWLTGITSVTAGNIYVIDQNRIREVARSTGFVRTVAGNGSHSVSGDGGRAIDAGIGVSTGLSIDAQGNFFISSLTTIRRVDASSGIITTIAGTDGVRGFSGDGGPASETLLDGPSAPSFDALGNLYFADRGNHRIRRIDVGSGRVSTIAGNGVAGFGGDGGSAIDAELNGPENVAIDGKGNLFIYDGQNHRIRKIVAATGKIITYAGNGESGFSGDGGPAASAQFGQIQGMVVDGQGNLYLGDSTNNRVREVDASMGTISTIAGDGVLGLSGDDGPAVSAELETICGIAVDRTGYLYILNSGAGIVRAVGPGSAQAPVSYAVTVSSSDPKPLMGEQITLTAGVVSDLGLPALSGTVSWFNGSKLIGKSNVDGTGTASLVTVLGDGGDALITASYAGTLSGYGTVMLPVFGFAMSPNPSALETVAAQKSVQFGISMKAFHGFTGEVDLSCSGLAYPGYCTFSTSTANFTNTVATQDVTLTVHTASPATVQLTSGTQIPFILAALCPVLFLLRKKQVRRYFLALIFAAMGVGLSCGISGCSGGSTPTPPSAAVSGSSILTAGTYNFTVEATSGSDVVRLPVTMVVE